MEVLHGYRALEQPPARAAVALGNFDGVHRGHQGLLDAAVRASRRLGGPAIAYTFEPHPAKILAPDVAPHLVTTPARKLELIADRGIDLCVLEPFTRDLASMPAETFLDQVIRGALAPAHVVVGYDFSFGKGRGGTVNTLRAFGERHGIEVEVVDPVAVDGLVASSTKARNFVRAGNMEGARRVLGRDFEIDGRVVRGAARGKAIGFPTANIDPETELLPAGGVYAVEVQLRDGDDPERRLPGAANLGTNPTFESEGALSLEVHLLDFDGDLYGRRLRVSFVERLRPEHRFDDVDGLIAQMHRDVDATRAILRERGDVGET